MFFNGSLHIDELVLTNQQELIYVMRCSDTGCCLEDLPEALDDRDE